jgi:hypothetical protein
MIRKRIGIGEEGIMHKQFASVVSKYEACKKLNCQFWSYNASGEKRNEKTGALLKAKGLKKGQPDYTFYYIQKNIDIYNDFLIKILFLEFKTAKGKQSESQKEFELIFDDMQNVDYFIAHSVEEAINILQKKQIISF